MESPITQAGFRDLVIEALAAAGMPVFMIRPTERIDLGSGDRLVRLDMVRHESRSPFTCALVVEWVWNSLVQARVQTCEEDVLATMFGNEEVLPDTEPLYLRIDVTFVAAAGMEAALAMPTEAAWRSWWTAVEHNMGSLLPSEFVELEDGRTAVNACRLKPEVEMDTDTDGHLILSCLKLRAWSIVEIPRAFDDSDKEDPDPHDEIEDLTERIASALNAWEHCLAQLRPEGLRPS